MHDGYRTKNSGETVCGILERQRLRKGRKSIVLAVFAPRSSWSRKLKEFISFENQVKLDHTSFIDGFIPSTHVMIEQKGIDKDLKKPVKQSDGSLLTPFQQAKRYAAELPYSQRLRGYAGIGFDVKTTTESSCVAELMKLYQKMTKQRTV